MVSSLRGVSGNSQNIISQIHEVTHQIEDEWFIKRLSHCALSLNRPVTNETKARIKEVFGISTDEELNKLLQDRQRAEIKNIFKIATIPCFRSFDMSFKKIIVGGDVAIDGWGDYFQMFLTAKNLSEIFTKSQIYISTDIRFRPSLPKLSKELESINKLILSNSETSKEKIVYDKLKDADFIVHIPHGRIPNPGNKPELIVNEYGFNTGENYALGLRENNYETLGISLVKVSDAISVKELEHVSLRNYLMEKKQSFFLGYLKKIQNDFESHRIGFVYTVIASQEKQKNDIIIICPMEKIEAIQSEILKPFGIKDVILLTANNGCLKKEKTLKIQESGKNVTIINPFPLSHGDWRILLKFCKPVVGCTGDMSFSEALSNNKIPFYQIRWHKVDFIKQVINLTALYKKKFPNLCLYFKAILEELKENQKKMVSEKFIKIGKLIDQTLIDEFYIFVSHIKKYHSAKVIMADIIRRELAYAEYPQLKKDEKELFISWEKGQKNLLQIKKEMEGKVKKSTIN